MPQTLMAEQSGPDLDPTKKSYSCLICRRRKVKCDRRNPCSNCVKAAQQCSFLAPLRGRRKRTKPPKEGLHAKLKRYEELLKSYGAKIEPSEYDDDDSDSASMSRPDVEDDDMQNKVDGISFALEGIRPRLIDKEGSSRYVDR
jgi:Fungal Zn(2)-Cys(6) binuclear cluster domain